jgi:hypothetical protein
MKSLEFSWVSTALSERQLFLLFHLLFFYQPLLLSSLF